MPQIVLFVVVFATFLVGGGFFVKGALEKEPHKRIRLSLYGFAFMLLGYLGNHLIGG